jgi:hypothetical protein
MRYATQEQLELAAELGFERRRTIAGDTFTCGRLHVWPVWDGWRAAHRRSEARHYRTLEAALRGEMEVAA